MLTPEEVRTLLLPLNTEYIKTHGTDRDWLVEDSYRYLGVEHNRRLMNKPFRQGGRPYNGIAFDVVYDEYFGGQFWRYTEFKDGYYYGDDVIFYDSGALASYERKDDEEHYRYDWDEDGVLQAVTEWNRRDNPAYYRKRVYDIYHNPGRLLRMTLQCEISAVYRTDGAESPYDFTFRENGEFRQITCKAPTVRDFYTEVELDPDGIPVRFLVNPHYTEDKLEKRLKDGSPRCETFNGAKYRLDRWSDHVRLRVKTQTPRYGLQWFSADACIRFRDSKQGDSIFAYKSGKQQGKQCLYYPDGQIREVYYLSEGKDYFSEGKEYDRHLYWHPNGIMREAVIYSNGKVLLHVTFDDKGNLLSYQLNSDVFEGK